MTPNSLAFRLLVSAGLVSMAVLAATGWLLASLFKDNVERGFESRLGVHLDGLVAFSEVAADGTLSLDRELPDSRFEQPYSGYYWQIEGAGQTLRSRSLWDQTLAAPPAAGDGRTRRGRVTGPEGQSLQVLGATITLPGSKREFLFLVAADRAEIAGELDRFNGVLGWSLALLCLGLLVVILVQVRFGLRPLRRIREALGEIRGGARDRLEGPWPSEVAPLAGELNALLDDNAAIVERARGSVGNLAHALKTPLSVLAAEAERAPGTPLSAAVRQHAETMRRLVDHYLSRARTAAPRSVLGARTEVAAVVEALARTLERIHAGRAVTVERHCAAGLAFQGERQDLEEMLGNLMDNAWKWATGRVRVTSGAEAGRLVVVVEDDGPGLPAERRLEAMERGRRLDEGTPGSGLGLSIVGEIAGLYGGRLELDGSALGGLAARLTLPAATRSPG